MHVAIVYDSRTGTTEGAARDMARIAESAGHTCSVTRVKDADESTVAEADVVCVGSWTQGLFFVLQHATKATMKFIDGLPDLHGKPAAVFCTYKTSPGHLLNTMAHHLQHRGARVTGHFRSRGPTAGDGFRAWLSDIVIETPHTADVA